jgi:hypothetical protein
MKFIFTCPYWIFADDTKAAVSIDKNDPASCVSQLQSDVDRLFAWTQLWGLQFNAEKCSVLHVGSTNPRLPYHIAGTEIATVETQRDLGITVSSDWKFSTHVANISANARQTLGCIRRTFVSRRPEILVPLFRSLVIPKLEFSPCAFDVYLQKDKDELEKVFRLFVKMFPHLRGLSFDQKLKQLRLESPVKRREDHDLRQFHAIFVGEGRCGIQFDDFFKLREGKASLRNYHPNNVAVPRTHVNARTHSFVPRSCLLWNDIPSRMKEEPSPKIFKDILKYR